MYNIIWNTIVNYHRRISLLQQWNALKYLEILDVPYTKIVWVNYLYVTWRHNYVIVQKDTILVFILAEKWPFYDKNEIKYIKSKLIEHQKWFPTFKQIITLKCLRYAWLKKGSFGHWELGIGKLLCSGH